MQSQNSNLDLWGQPKTDSFPQRSEPSRESPQGMWRRGQRPGPTFSGRTAPFMQVEVGGSGGPLRPFPNPHQARVSWDLPTASPQAALLALLHGNLTFSLFICAPLFLALLPFSITSPHSPLLPSCLSASSSWSLCGEERAELGRAKPWALTHKHLAQIQASPPGAKPLHLSECLCLLL